MSVMSKYSSKATSTFISNWISSLAKINNSLKECDLLINVSCDAMVLMMTGTTGDDTYCI